MTILILFASKSDEETYTRIATGLKKHGIEYELRIASAHKTPDKAEEIIKIMITRRIPPKTEMTTNLILL